MSTSYVYACMNECVCGRYVKEREPHDYAKFQSASAMTLQSTATHITMPHSILTAVRAGQLSHVTVESCHSSVMSHLSTGVKLQYMHAPTTVTSIVPTSICNLNANARTVTHTL